MSEMTWYEIVTNSDSVNAVATKAKIVQTTLNRQVQRGRLSPEVVIAIARGYKAPVLDALVSCGYLTEEEAALKDRFGLEEALQDATDEQLLRELLRRINTEGSLEHPDLVTPLDNTHPAMHIYGGGYREPLTTDIDAPTSPSGGVFEVYDGSQPPERSAAQVGNVGAEQGTPDDLGEESQIPPEDWDD